MILYFGSATFIDLLRLWTGPLPKYICMIGLVVKNVFPINIGLNIFVRISTRFIFVFVYKSVPALNDDFLGLFLTLLYNMISFLTTAARFHLPGRPVLNELICTGTFYQHWSQEPTKNPVHAVLPLAFLMISGVLLIPLKMATLIWNRRDQRPNRINLGGNSTTLLATSVIASGTVLALKLNSLENPLLLNEYPLKLLVFGLYFAYPILANFAFCLMFYRKHYKLFQKIKALF